MQVTQNLSAQHLGLCLGRLHGNLVGGSAVEVPRKPTWTRKLHKERLAEAEAAKAAKGGKKA